MSLYDSLSGMQADTYTFEFRSVVQTLERTEDTVRVL
jgi:hypothetical protein